MSGAAKLQIRVREAETISPLLKRFVFESADRSPLPPTGPGAHIRLLLQNGSKKWRNAYSIAAAEADRSAFSIIVRRVPDSRGGSAFLHQAVEPGQILEADQPGNLFALARVARKHLMVSGGVGITPFLSYLAHFKAAGTPFELHHFCRIDEAETFSHLLRDFDSAQIHIHPASTQFDIAEMLRMQPLGTHLYTCGPEAVMDIVLTAARAQGWPASKLHWESFGGAHAGGTPFIAVLARSGAEIVVREDQTLLEAIEEAGFEPSCLCRGGACGQCVTEVIEGVPEHRDHYLSAADRAGNKSIVICVSRARGDRIVLDL